MILIRDHQRGEPPLKHSLKTRRTSQSHTHVPPNRHFSIKIWKFIISQKPIFASFLHFPSLQPAQPRGRVFVPKGQSFGGGGGVDSAGAVEEGGWWRVGRRVVLLARPPHSNEVRGSAPGWASLHVHSGACMLWRARTQSVPTVGAARPG